MPAGQTQRPGNGRTVDVSIENTNFVTSLFQRRGQVDGNDRLSNTAFGRLK